MAKKRASRASTSTAKGSTARVKKEAKAKKLQLTFGFTMDIYPDERTLFIMPIAKPNDRNMRESLDRALQTETGEQFSVNSVLVSRIIEAHADGRVLWGWSPWRAGAESLTWQEWDGFCARWFQCCAKLETRPTSKFGVDKNESVNALCDEVDFLIRKKKVALISNFPFGYKKKR